MDRVEKFLAYNGKINITCVSTTDLVENARKIHDLSPLATATLGRCLTIGTLMGISLKGQDDNITIQIKGNGPIGDITVVANSNRKS